MSVQTGKDVLVYYYTGNFASLLASGTLVGLAESANWSIDEGLEEYHGAGKRLPWGIAPGPKSITLTIEGLWVNSNIQKTVIDEIVKSGSVNPFHIAISGRERAFRFSGCYIESVDQENAADGWSTISMDLRALGIS